MKTANTDTAPFLNESLLLSTLCRSYRDFCSKEYFGLRSYENSDQLLMIIHWQLASLATGKYPLHIYSHKNKQHFVYDEINEWYTQKSSQGFNRPEIKQLRYNNDDQGSLDTIGAGAMIFLANDKEDIEYLRERIAIFQTIYSICILYSPEDVEETGDFQSFTHFKYIRIHPRQLYDNKLIHRFLITISKNFKKDFNLQANRYANFLWSQYVHCLKKIDKDIDTELLGVEKKLKIASIENPQGLMGASASTSFSTIKSSLEKYMRDTSGDFQKKSSFTLDNTFNAESGSLVQSLSDQIENFDTAVLLSEKSTKRKDIAEVRLNSNFIGPLQAKMDAEFNSVFHGRVKKDIESVFRGIINDVNHDLSNHKVGNISSKHVDLTIEERLNKTLIEKTIGCNYVSEISFVGKRGIFSKIKALREGAFQLMIFVMLLGFINPHWDYTYRKVMDFQTADNKALDSHTIIFDENGKLKDGLFKKEVKLELVKTTLVGEISYLFSHGEPFSATKDKIFIKNDLEMVEGKPMDILGRGSFIGMLIATVLMVFSYIEYKQHNKQFLSDETEKHLRNIKNELKGSVKKACQNINKNTREFVNECFNGILNDVLQSLEILKQQAEEREKETLAQKNEQMLQLKYVKMRQFELGKYKIFNKAKIDESDKVKINVS